MLLPVTFGLSPTTAMIMLAGIYYGAQYGGSTTSILVNIPGRRHRSSPAWTVTRWPVRGGGPGAGGLGDRLILRGLRGNGRLGDVRTAAGQVALKFGPAEYFSLIVFGLVGPRSWRTGRSSRQSPWLLLGLLIGMVGMDANSGVHRFTFGIMELVDGIGFIGLTMGVFGISEIISNLELKGSREVFTTRTCG